MLTRLGLIVPSCNTVLEADLAAISVPNVTFHFTRIPLLNDDENQLASLFETVSGAVELLSHARVKAIALGCTGGSFFRGKGYDQVIIDEMKKHTLIPCTTTATAAVEGLRKLKVRSLILLTPYVKWLGQRAAEFLAAHGFKIIVEDHLGIDDPFEMAGFTPQQIVRWAQSKQHPEAEGMLISCTCFPALSIADALERKLQIPVVTSNQATIWQLLQQAKAAVSISGYGTLLQNHT